MAVGIKSGGDIIIVADLCDKAYVDEKVNAIWEYLRDQENTRVIGTADDLTSWNTEAQSNPSLNAVLADDIDMTGKSWTPIGDESSPYTGTFNGNGHTISNVNASTAVTINGTSERGCGLFGVVAEEGTVKDLTLDGITSSSSGDASSSYLSQASGGIAAVSSGTISGCKVESGTISASLAPSSSGDNYYNGTSYAGGIVAFLAGGSIEGCSVSESVSVSSSGASTAAGGIAGSVDGDISISGCSNAGSISATIRTVTDGSSMSAQVGGIAGDGGGAAIGSCTNSGKISYTGATGSDSTGSISAGGIAGYSGGSITGCTHSGTVSGTANMSTVWAGGIAGWSNGTLDSNTNSGSPSNDTGR